MYTKMVVHIYTSTNVFPFGFREKWPCARHISFTQTATSYTTDHNSFLNGFFYMKNDRVFYHRQRTRARFFLSAVQQMRFHVPSFLTPAATRVFFIHRVLCGARQCFIYTRFSTYKRFPPLPSSSRSAGSVFRRTSVRPLSVPGRVHVHVL